MGLLHIVMACALVFALGALVALLFFILPDRSTVVPEAPEARRKRSQRLRAVAACAGPGATARIHRYAGYGDCRLLRSIYNGDRRCQDSCLGLGTCRALCPRGAILSGPDGAPTVTDDCDGCGLCVRECPSGVLKLLRTSADYYVRCVSKSEAPAARTSFCASACTACGLCVRTSVGAGFAVRGGLAVVDYAAKGDRGPGAESCPTRCIVPLSTKERGKNAFQRLFYALEWKKRSSGSMDVNT